MISDNHIVKSLKELLEKGLSVMHVEGFKVMQHSMQTNHAATSVVLFQKLSVKRIGWQGNRYEDIPNDDKKMTEVQEYIEDAYFQISAFRPRLVEDTPDTVTGIDALNALIAYFQSTSGIDECNKHGMHPFRVTDLNEAYTEDDSSMPQINPSFDIHFNVSQERNMEVETVREFGGEVHLVNAAADVGDSHEDGGGESEGKEKEEEEVGGGEGGTDKPEHHGDYPV